MLSLYISNMTASLFVNKLPKIPWSSGKLIQLPYFTWQLVTPQIQRSIPTVKDKYEKYKLSKLKKEGSGEFLGDLGVRISAFTAEAWVRSPVEEPSHMLLLAQPKYKNKLINKLDKFPVTSAESYRSGAGLTPFLNPYRFIHGVVRSSKNN